MPKLEPTFTLSQVKEMLNRAASVVQGDLGDSEEMDLFYEAMEAQLHGQPAESVVGTMEDI